MKSHLVYTSALYHRLRSLRSDTVLYERLAAVGIWGIKGETPRACVALRKIIAYSSSRRIIGKRLFAEPLKYIDLPDRSTIGKRAMPQCNCCRSSANCTAAGLLKGVRGNINKPNTRPRAKHTHTHIRTRIHALALTYTHNTNTITHAHSWVVFTPDTGSPF